MWKRGTLKHEGRIYKYCMKVFEEGSIYGINEGRISKLWMKRDGIVVCNYDRNWEIYPTDEIDEEAMQILYFAEEN